MNSHSTAKKPTWEDYNLFAYFSDDVLVVRKGEDEHIFPFWEGFLQFVTVDAELFGLHDYFGEECLDIEQLSHTVGGCLILSLFAPTLDDENTDELFEYSKELRKLQLRYKSLMDFCLNQGVFPDELGTMSAYQRLNLFGEFRGGYVPQALTSILTLDEAATDTFEGDDSLEQSPMERLFNIPAGLVAHVGRQKLEPARGYMLHSTSDMLTLIFHELVLRDLKIKCCKQCQQYFVVKTKRNSDYCDRIAKGSTQTCQKMAAMEKFKATKADDPAYQIFNRYYKRYHERKKVGTIKADVFDTWNREACTWRDACIDGKKDVVDFELWCHGSFTNRPKKT